ncbi:MAG: Stp1/IreP family PP2C-type Ser/Thr phosphatase [Armatimonadota bacterium]|nr:Stp1/IreP family PP2C-type Ser/Thr phosphatase [Armatimonadota bacterium]
MAIPTLSSSYKTHKGKRLSNEDACLAVPSEQLGGVLDGLYIVADGMGGRSSGSVASVMAVNTIRDVLLSQLVSGIMDIKGALAHSFKAANDAIYRQAASSPELQGMGTTCVVAAVKGEQVYLGHMGDSRAYLFRNGELCRLTEDHSFVAEKIKAGEITEEQARKSRFRNVVTRTVGIEPDAEPEISSTDLKLGDILLLCTDGLTVPVSEVEIKSILASVSGPEEACDELVNAALRNGGSDNITAVVAAYGWDKSITPAMPRNKRSFSIFIGIIGLLLGIGIGLCGSNLLPSRHLKPPPIKKAQTRRISLANIEYDEPVSLSYVPLQGKILLLNQQGFIHVVDREGRLLRLDSSGAILGTLAANDLLKPKPSMASFMIASDFQGNLYISNPVGKQIVKFAPDGLFLRTIGEGKLVAPEALAVDKDGNIFVIDSGRLKVIRVKAQSEVSNGP